MRICVIKATGRLIEMQSEARPGTLIANAVALGFSAHDIEERDASQPEFDLLIAAANEAPP